MTDRESLPLSAARVIDLAEGRLQGVGRLLADLGAQVVRIEPPDGSPDRRSGAVHDGVSLTFLARNAGKESLVLDPLAPGERLPELLTGADIVLVTPHSTPYDVASIRAARTANPRLVILQLTDFGLTGPGRNWLATPAVQLALSTVLSRSGLPEVPEPLAPPEFLAYEAAAAQALWVAVLAFYQAQRTGLGDDIDFSVWEALVQVLDPGMGIGGSARAGAPMRDLPRGRPDARNLYPIFPGRDGWIRICVLSARQWQGMFAWLGEPAEFADPKFSRIGDRYLAAGTLYPLIGRMLAGLTREEATRAGQSFGVPVAGMASVSEVLTTEAFVEAGAFRSVDLPDGRTATLPSGWFDIDGRRAGFRTSAPEIGSLPTHFTFGTAPVTASTAAPTAAPRSRPFAGLRVLDLGVIVVGAELGRLLGDYGADVIKVESQAFPDGSRQSYDGSEITEGFAFGHRNKRSLGLNLKHEDGKRIFRDLIAVSDVILTNFKPGTLESLGFGWDELLRINPRIVLSESSAFGNSGPWARRLGYGPLVRASAGLSALWRYPDIDGSFADAITIFPDHLVARLNASAVAALLLRRDRTGQGGRVSTAQVDAIFGAMADLLALESLQPNTIDVGYRESADAPGGTFPTAGDDDWLVVDGCGNEQFRALAAVVGRPEWVADPAYASAAGRLENRAVLDAAVAAWAAQRSSPEAARVLQAAGVPAGAMLRVADLEADPQLTARSFFAEYRHPHLAGPVPGMLGEALFENLPAPLLRPAPLMAEHTVEIVAEVLGMDTDTITRLLDDGVLEVRAAQRPAAVSI